MRRLGHTRHNEKCCWWPHHDIVCVIDKTRLSELAHQQPTVRNATDVSGEDPLNLSFAVGKQ